jgi:WD40 repeat protein
MRQGVSQSLAHDKTVRVWSLTDGKLLQTIRVPTGPGHDDKIFAVAMSPDGNFVAAGGSIGWSQEHPIYVFDTRTGIMTVRIAGVSGTTHSLTFSSDGRYLAAGLGPRGSLRVYDRDRQWAEVTRDTNYGGSVGSVYGITFAVDGRLATASLDGNVRLYDRDFKLAIPPRKATGGNEPLRIVFSPDGTMLAVGYADAATVDLLDGHSLESLPRPNVDGLRNGSLNRVAWSKDGKTLYAGGSPNNGVLAWANMGRGERRTLPAGTSTVSGLAALPWPAPGCSLRPVFGVIGIRWQNSLGAPRAPS